MARNRMVQQELFRSPAFCGLKFPARTLLIGLMVYADDYGGFEANPMLVRSGVFPMDEHAPDDIDSWLDELEEASFISRYGDGQYADITGWTVKGSNTYQSIDKRWAKKRVPSRRELGEVSESPPRDHSENSMSTQRGLNEATARPLRISRRGTRTSTGSPKRSSIGSGSATGSRAHGSGSGTRTKKLIPKRKPVSRRVTPVELDPDMAKPRLGEAVAFHILWCLNHFGPTLTVDQISKHLNDMDVQEVLHQITTKPQLFRAEEA
ncbi:hypothetical protein [Kribbella jiaozuonensis]|uniref:Uncharacterized protein n=1 Tax=Kribbella jiaozuonensis TaxID=2575441 RepID=A0A4U3LT58_9ACTN|nr:hypothetical protein [Kribbella jiaozuonensis]TKK79205.1 hypothetical protein FDA38_12305 [Kribbella jiaozuonensis]TKK83275.1 hypothetical protein FDA38_11260 [Kribbella jiaozuonensis]